MTDRFEDPLFSWAVWSALIALGVFIVLIQLLPETWQADKTKISIIILIVFFFGWFLSFLHARSLREDWKAVGDLIHGVEPTVSPDCYLWNLLNGARVRMGAGTDVPADQLISTYQMRRDHKRRILSLLSSTLITVGLIGTILGLITSMTGLNEIVMSVDTTRGDLITGLRQTISGMGTAFFTTLYGAIFGGVMLKVLAHQTHSSMISISGMAMEYLEEHAVGDAAEQMSIVEAAREEMINFSTELSDSMNQLHSSLGKARRELDEFSSTLLSSKMVQISEQLEGIARSLRPLGDSRDPLRGNEVRPPSEPPPHADNE